MEAFTERRRLIALACGHLKDLLKLCRMSSQDMSEVIMHPCLSLNTPAQQHTHTLVLSMIYTTATSADCKMTLSWSLHFPFIVYSSLCNREILFNAMFFSNCWWFSQAKYWNSSVNEVEGTITDNKGKVIRKLFGKWHEAVFCGDPPSATCIWRASTTSFFHNNALFAMHSSLWQYLMQWMLFVCDVGAMPVDYEQYYGFTKFAIELNELDPSLKLLLPPTDTRLRVDQR